MQKALSHLKHGPMGLGALLKTLGPKSILLAGSGPGGMDGTCSHQGKHGFPRNPDSMTISSKGGQPVEAQARGNGHKRNLYE